jgi:arginyl-tRNA synthetase
MYARDGAEWFKSTDYGDDEDRVVIRANGEKTYFASDIAYHFDKRQRGHDLLIDVWGADHHGYVTRVRGALQAFGAPGDCFEVTLLQLVSLFRGGEKLQMGKREGNFVTLRELRNEVGNDACRFFYLMRSHDQALDFDLELAKSRSNENPVYYVQYAHARVCSVMKELAARGYEYEAAAGAASLAHLGHAARAGRDHGALEIPGDRRAGGAESRTACAGPLPARSCEYAAHLLQTRKKWIVEDSALRNARITLALAVQQVVRNGLSLLGVSAPESM